MAYFFVLIGLIMLILGGEYLVSGAASIAYKLKISPILVGIIIVGLGTSAPELLVATQAVYNNMPDIAVGNIIGSNICNILLILGVSSLITTIQVTYNKILLRDVTIMSLMTALFAVIVMIGSISRLMALFLISLCVIYLLYIYFEEKNADSIAEIEDNLTDKASILGNILKITFGIVALILGPKFLIDGSVTLAREFGLSEAMIGLSIIAVGTSLPELAAAISACIRKETDILLGNVIGSNIFNILLISGGTALMKPFHIGATFLDMDVPFMCVSMILLAIIIYGKISINRFIGAGFLGLYIIYIVSMI